MWYPRVHLGGSIMLVSVAICDANVMQENSAATATGPGEGEDEETECEAMIDCKWVVLRVSASGLACSCQIYCVDVPSPQCRPVGMCAIVCYSLCLRYDHGQSAEIRYGRSARPP